MQAGRLFGILYYILDKRHATAPELAKKFEVSVRTIYRDIDAISGAGIPIYVTTGRNGGIQFLDDYVLDKSFFSHKERQEILSGIQSLSAAQYPDIDHILKKLGATFQVGLTDWIEVDFSRWGSIAEHENELFRQLKQAIFEKQIIHFEYDNSSGTNSWREAMPLKLVYKDKAWYLHAFCPINRDTRLFRLTRMKNLTLTEAQFEHAPDANEHVFPEPQEMGELVELELDFSLEVGYRLYDTLDKSAITKNENGYIVKLTLPETDWLYSFLMSFGDKVTIIRPESVRRKLIEKYEAALNHFKEV
ncbi:YafY family transcriptional regulator [Blautia schinkii]|nr:YafY family transcriptional regulator [Blautia schinkii]